MPKIDPRLLVSRQLETLRRAHKQQDEALSCQQHDCCFCGTPAFIETPHCTDRHLWAQKLVQAEINFAEQTRSLLMERNGEDPS